MSKAIVNVERVEAHKTQSGNTRFVLLDDGGREYSTFKEPIARQALAAEGERARIQVHETQKGNFTNVYLDAVEREVPPEEFFEKVKPLKDLVADDIRPDSPDEPET